MDFKKYIILENLEKFRQSLVDRKHADKIPAAKTYLEYSTSKSGKKRSILSTSVKWSKVDGYKNYGVTGLYLVPFKHILGLNFCAFAALCAKGCIGYTGHLGMFHQNTLEWKSLALYHHTLEFLLDMLKELYIQCLRASMEDKEIWARFNGSADVRWERIIRIDMMVEDFNGLKGLYDYTKYPRVTNIYQHYHLTYSLSEITTDRQLKYNLNTLNSVAVVLPKKDKLRLLDNYPSLFCDGDLHDMRPLDKKTIVLLQGKRATAKGKELSSGFIESYDSLLTRLDAIGYMEGVQ